MKKKKKSLHCLTEIFDSDFFLPSGGKIKTQTKYIQPYKQCTLILNFFTTVKQSTLKLILYDPSNGFNKSSNYMCKPNHVILIILTNST